ncbi:MAG: hypothetical protein ABIP39_06410, partial [Polyangiaceae bacterium]
MVVDTADPAAGDFDEVIITVDDQPRDETLGRELSFPLWFGVEAGSNSSALVKFSVTAKKTNRVILSDVVAMASFVKSESHVVHFTLCPCKGDGCAATYVYDDSLPEWTGGLPPPQSCTGSRDGGVEGDGGSEDGSSGDATA